MSFATLHLVGKARPLHAGLPGGLSPLSFRETVTSESFYESA